ncbi:hypothetical protein BHE74_00043315, partial [Ensete ventricosum]
ARARRGEARAPRSISGRRASKRRRLGARPSLGAGRFGRAPGLNQAFSLVQSKSNQLTHQ